MVGGWKPQKVPSHPIKGRQRHAPTLRTRAWSARALFNLLSGLCRKPVGPGGQAQTAISPATGEPYLLTASLGLRDRTCGHCPRMFSPAPENKEAWEAPAPL